MSKIALIAEDRISNSLLMDLKRATGKSLSAIRDHIQAQMPFLEAVLFQNDHVEVARQLRAVVEIIGKAGVRFRVYELEPDEQFESAPIEECEIDASVLENILSAADDQYL